MSTSNPDSIRAHFAGWPAYPTGSNADIAAQLLARGTDDSRARAHALVSIAESLERIATSLEQPR